MKFNKKEITTYELKRYMYSSDDFVYDVSSNVRMFIKALRKKIDNDGYKCDEYDILYLPPYSENKFLLWFAIYPNNQGLLVLGLPLIALRTCKVEVIQEEIEKVLKEENENVQI